MMLLYNHNTIIILSRILHNPCLSLYVKRQVILSILRPSLDVWRCTMSQFKALDAVLLAECKKILCCSSKTCSEAVWGDLGIEPLDLRKKQEKSSLVFKIIEKR